LPPLLMPQKSLLLKAASDRQRRRRC